MKKTFLLLAIVLCSFTFANAQTKTVTNHSIGINILGLGYTYEQALGGKFTLNSSIELQNLLTWSDNSFTLNGYETVKSNDFDYAMLPYISVSPRYYYNLDKRERMGKNINRNSANYLALSLGYAFKPIVQNNEGTTIYNDFILLSPHWGMQRVYNNKWLIDLKLGVNFGYSLGSEKEFGCAPNINFRFGYVF